MKQLCSKQGQEHEGWDLLESPYSTYHKSLGLIIVFLGFYCSFPNRGDPNIDPKILYFLGPQKGSLLWETPPVGALSGNP